MEDKRRFLEKGTILKLAGVTYCLEGVEGYGESAVVYRASYEDNLNQGCRHYVLIKELFPRDPIGNIYRDETGKICCVKDGEDLMKQYRTEFFKGNQANLQLLEQNPGKISGNLNSFEAYGTIYTVLSVHGGSSLAAVLAETGRHWTLKESAEIILKILDAAEYFHQCGIVHLDISPDNILLMPERAFLIDYNSVWIMGKSDIGKYELCGKEGFSAPEVRLREMGNIGPAADLYSICAVWFLMLTGRRLTEDESRGKGLGKSFPKTLEIFSGEPETAAWKTVQIVTKGLHILVSQRYQSVQELRAEIQEVIRRIEGKGISQEAVWESSHKNLMSQKTSQEQYLEQGIWLYSGDAGEGSVCTPKECGELLEKGAGILLTGPGGMGKTRLLTELWAKYETCYSPSKAAAVYIPLVDYQQAGEEAFFIRKYLLRSFKEQTGNVEEMLQEWNRQMEASGGWKLILLLDGFNEAGSARRKLLKEIEDLERIPGIGILVTDRSDSVKEYGLAQFQTAELMALSDTVVKEELERDGLVCPRQPELWNLLRTPMMLSLYRKTVLMAEESGKETEWKDGEVGLRELIGGYLDSLFLHEQRVHIGNLGEQLRQKYLIYHFLPEIARELKYRRKTILTTEELYSLAAKSYRNLSHKKFVMAFPEYLGKSRLMLEGIADSMEWFDYAVEEQLREHLNLLSHSSQGNYRLVHDNFLEYLSEKAEENRNIWKGVKTKRGSFLAVAAAAVLVGSGVYYGNEILKAGRILPEETLPQSQLKETLPQLLTEGTSQQLQEEETLPQSQEEALPQFQPEIESDTFDAEDSAGESTSLTGGGGWLIFNLRRQRLSDLVNKNEESTNRIEAEPGVSSDESEENMKRMEEELESISNEIKEEIRKANVKLD